MTELYQLESWRWMLLLFLLVLSQTSYAQEITRDRTSDSKLQGSKFDSVVIECGASPLHPSNITQTVTSRHLGGFYTRGQRLQCVSQLQRRGQGYVHVIYDVLSHDCGAKSDGKNGFAITVYLTSHTTNNGEEAQREFSCHYYDNDFTKLRHHTQSDDVTRTPNDAAQAGSTPKLSPAGGRRRGGVTTLRPERIFKSPKNAAYYKQNSDAGGSLKGSRGVVDVIPATSQPSVLQLNVIDSDGKMTAVVYPGKLVALELHTAHDAPFGAPMIHQCKVTNPFSGMKKQLFSVTILQFGCGSGEVLPASSGFVKNGRGFATPFFSVPDDWASQSALLFSCDVIICADVTKCHQSCPPQNQSPTTPGQHDVPVVLDSQIVTSCPPVDDVNSASDVSWNDPILPECIPNERRVPGLVYPSDDDQNSTAGVVGSGFGPGDVTQRSAMSSWLAGHLHYVIIIGVLALFIIVFMFATFCKMIAVQKQVDRCSKLAGVGRGQQDDHNQQQQQQQHSRESTASESQQDQMTQTPRPLPRAPNGRSGSHHGHGQTQTLNPQQSRQVGDGAPTTAAELLPDGVGPPRPQSAGGGSGGTQVSGYDNVPGDCRPDVTVTMATSPSCTMTLPLRGSFKVRRAYDVPPTHGDLQQGELRASAFLAAGGGNAENIPLRPCDTKTYKTSSTSPSALDNTTNLQDRRTAAGTIIEIKPNFHPQDKSKRGGGGGRPQEEKRGRGSLAGRPEEEGRNRGSFTGRPEEEGRASRGSFAGRPEEEGRSRGSFAGRPEEDGRASRGSFAGRPEEEGRSRGSFAGRPEEEARSRGSLAGRPVEEVRVRGSLAEDGRSSRGSFAGRPEEEGRARLSLAEEDARTRRSFTGRTEEGERKGRGSNKEEEKGRSKSMVWKPPPDHLSTFTGGYNHHNNNNNNSNSNNNNNNNTVDRERGVVLGVNSLRRHLDRDHQLFYAQPRDRRPISTPSGSGHAHTLHQLPIATSPDAGHAHTLHQLPIATSPDAGHAHTLQHQPIATSSASGGHAHTSGHVQPSGSGGLAHPSGLNHAHHPLQQHQDTVTAQVFYNIPALCSEDSSSALKDASKPDLVADGAYLKSAAGRSSSRTSSDSSASCRGKSLSPPVISISPVEENTRL